MLFHACSVFVLFMSTIIEKYVQLYKYYSKKEHVTFFYLYCLIFFSCKNKKKFKKILFNLKLTFILIL